MFLVVVLVFLSGDGGVGGVRRGGCLRCHCDEI